MPPSLPDDYSRPSTSLPAPQPTLLRVTFSNVKFEQNNIRSKPFQGSPWYCRKKHLPACPSMHPGQSLTCHLALPGSSSMPASRPLPLLSLLPCCFLSIFLHSENFPGHKWIQKFLVFSLRASSTTLDMFYNHAPCFFFTACPPSPTPESMLYEGRNLLSQ